MRKTACLSVLAAFLSLSVGAGDAEAHGWVRVPLYIALTKAHQLWGTEPCGGKLVVVMSVERTRYGGQAEWDSPTGHDAYTSPPSTYTNCAMYLNPDEWTPQAIRDTWPSTCSTVLHEYGHLTGHIHSDEPIVEWASGLFEQDWLPVAPQYQVPETPEQLEVMRGGRGDMSDDLTRCGWLP